MTSGSLVPFVDLRAALGHARREGERLAERVQRDVQRLVARGPVDLASDVRQLQRGLQSRADAAVKEIEARGGKVARALEHRVAIVADVVWQRLPATASRRELEALSRRVATLEERVMALESATRPRRARRRGVAGTA